MHYVSMKYNTNMKVIINSCHGGASFSNEFCLELVRQFPNKIEKICYKTVGVDAEFNNFNDNYDISTNEKYLRCKTNNDIFCIDRHCVNAIRDDQEIIEYIEKKYGTDLKQISGEFSYFVIESITDGFNYEVREYDGLEWIKEVYPYQNVIKELVKIIKDNISGEKLNENMKNYNVFVQELMRE